MSMQLTLDGSEVPHPPPGKPKGWRLYVVLWKLDEKSYGWIGAIGARSPADARRRTRREYGERIPADSELVAVAWRNWRPG